MGIKRSQFLTTIAIMAILNGLDLQAQEATQPLIVSPIRPIDAQPMVQPTGSIPQNTAVLLSLNDAITTKGNRWHTGDNFNLTVLQDVVVGDRIAIPRGSRGVGRITWLTNKGAFGKSGKLEIDIEYVETKGQRIPVSGSNREEGQGNAAATVGGVILAGVLAGFITGKSGTIPAGTQFTARTRNNHPIDLESLPLTKQAQQRLLAEQSRQRTQITSLRNKRVRCLTCR